MDSVYIFITAGVIIILLMIQYDYIQRKRFKRVIKQTSNVQPLYMMQSAGLKLNALKAAIRNYEIQNAGMPDNGLLSKVKARLEETMHEYNEGHIPLSQYYNRLSNIYEVLTRHTEAKNTIEAIGS